MKCFVLLTVLVFASKNENDVESVAANSGEKVVENAAENSIVVKIEEDEYGKKRRKSSKYIGVYYDENKAKWDVKRWNKTEKRVFRNGYHKDEETAAHASDTLARKLMANGDQEHKLNFPDDKTEVYREEKTKSSEYFGVFYNARDKRWYAQRWSKTEKRMYKNGCHKDEEIAAHASDTLARKLLVNGEQNHKLNFPDDSTEVHKKTKSSEYFGVFYNASDKRWMAQRWSSSEKKQFYNGYHRDEKTAAHASDNLARKLLAKGEQNHKLNFPDDSTEVEKTKRSKYVGVTYIEKSKKWIARRWDKTEKKLFTNGYSRDEETAAHASDFLARKLMANGEQDQKLNFPDDDTEVHVKKYQINKRKRSFDFEYSQTDKNDFEKFEEKEK